MHKLLKDNGGSMWYCFFYYYLIGLFKQWKFSLLCARFFIANLYV